MEMENNKVSFEVIVGSHNYRLNHEKSDVDKKAYTYPSFMDLYYGEKNSTTSVTNTEDTQFHDVRKLPSMLYKANINTLETLFSVGVIRSDGLHKELVSMREEIARMNLAYLYDSCFQGTYQRTIREFNRDQAYCDLRESEEALKEKTGKQLMRAYRILDFIIRYAKNGFESFEQAVRYDEEKEEDRKTKEFLLSLRKGKIGVHLFSDSLPDFLIEKQKEAEALEGLYKAKKSNEFLRTKVEELVKEHVRIELETELQNRHALQHEWEPTDNQGASMECVVCGKAITLEDQNDWNRNVDGICRKKEN